MKSNGKLVELIEKVKPEIRTLIEKCNTVGPCNHSLRHALSLIKSILGKCHFLRFLGQDVGSVVNPKNRRWQQFWCLNSGMVPHSSVLYLPAISYICCRQIRTCSNSSQFTVNFGV